MVRTWKEKVSITAHTLVKNEERFIWYAVMSVINHVDKVLLWDTGSSDGTLKIIEEIRKVGGDKIAFREYGNVNTNTFTKARQEMLDVTTTDWFMIVDGDEAWWEDSIRKVVGVVRGRGSLPVGRHGSIESIVVPTVNLVGDMYHRQEESAGHYHLAGRTGHLNLRGVNRKIPGLHSCGPHGQWGWVDGQNKMIQDRDPKKIVFVDAPYLHATHLIRSGKVDFEGDVPKRKLKRKYEIGVSLPLDFYYPEVFFRPRPNVVSSVWEKMDEGFNARARFETPMRRLKRRILPGRTGY